MRPFSNKVRGKAGSLHALALTLLHLLLHLTTLLHLLLHLLHTLIQLVIEFSGPSLEGICMSSFSLRTRLGGARLILRLGSLRLRPGIAIGVRPSSQESTLRL